MNRRYLLCSHISVVTTNWRTGIAEGTPLHPKSVSRRIKVTSKAWAWVRRICFTTSFAVLHDPSYRKDATLGRTQKSSRGAANPTSRILSPTALQRRDGWTNSPHQPRVGPSNWPSLTGAREVLGLPVPERLDSVEGVLRPEFASVAVPSTVDGGNMAGDDFALTASWGHHGQGGTVMPGQGRVVERPYTTDERVAFGGDVSTLGETTFDIYLKRPRLLAERPRRRLGSYKLGALPESFKKWLSSTGRPKGPR